MLEFSSPAMVTLFSLLWYLFLAAFLYLLDYFTACFRRWSVFTVLVPLLLLHHGISIPFVVEAALEAQGVPSSLYVVPWLGSMLFMYLFILIGAAFIGQAYPRTASVDSSLKNYFGKANMLPIYIIFSVSIIGVLAQMIIAPRFLGVVELFSGEVSADDYREQRFEFFESTSGVRNIGNYLVAVALSSVIPIVVFSTYQAKKVNPNYGPVFYGALFIFVGRAIFSGHKASMLISIVSLVALHLFLKHRGRLRISLAQVLVAVAMLFVFIPLLFYLQYSNFISSYAEAFQAGFYRLLVEPNRALQLYSYVYPELIDHLGGGSSRFFSALTGSDDVFIPPHTVLPLLWGVPEVTWNVVFIGDAWADFGMLGVIFESFIVGLLLKGIDEWFWNYSQRGWLEIAVFFAEIFSVARLGFGGLTTVLVGFGIIPSLLLWGLAVSVRSSRQVTN